MRTGLIAVIMSALLILGGGNHSQSAMAAKPGKYYLALGDSLGFGYVNDRTPLDPQCASPTAVGYVCVVYRHLRELNPAISVVNLSVPGADTCNLVYGYPGPNHECSHKPTPGGIPSPLDVAVQFIKAHPGQVNPVTLNIGGDDVLPLLPSALADPAGVLAKLPGILQRMQTSLDRALAALTAADPTLQIILITQYNALGGIGSPPLPAGFPELTATAIDSLNVVTKAEALKFNLPVADVASVFAEQPGGATTLTEAPASLAAGGLANINIHPTPQGYQIMGQVVIRTYSALVSPPGATPNAPRLTAHLASKLIRAGGSERVSGKTDSSARVQASLSLPGMAKAALRKRTLSVSPDGTFHWLFKVGRRSGKGSVRVCATSASGISACTRNMLFQIK